MQYVNTPVSPRIAWLPLALPALRWLKRYHCLFCKQWVMVVSKVTAALLLPSSTKKKKKIVIKHLRASHCHQTMGGRQELSVRALWAGSYNTDGENASKLRRGDAHI